jgi:RHS repeat-associated protein
MKETHFDGSGNVVTAGQAGFVDEAFAFTGRYFDAATGLQNNLHRWYDPAVGRWISEDPIGFAADDANLYRYLGNQPTAFIDPTGLRWSLPSWGDYWHYLWHPSEMDSDIQTAQKISLGVAAAAGGGAAGLYAGGAYAASSVAAGANAALASGEGAVVTTVVAVNAGYALGRPFGRDVADIGSFGAGYLVPLGNIRCQSGAPRNFSNPKFGQEVHQNFEKALLEQTGTTKGDWIIRTKLGQTGVDAEYIGSKNLAFKFAELKPRSPNGLNEFNSQVDRWRQSGHIKPGGSTSLWFYNEQGVICQGHITR